MEACWAHNPEVRRSKLRSARNLFYFFHLPWQLQFNRDHPKYLSCVPLAQRIARWTSNPKVLGSIPRWDGDIQWFVSVVVITSALHAEGRGFEPHTNLFCSINTQNDIMSGWPSGLRRQTQGNPLHSDRVLQWEFWSSYEGVGSNPTSDKYFEYIRNSFCCCTIELYHHWETWVYSSVVEQSAAVR